MSSQFDSFKQEQISIFNKEVELKNQTNKLLFEILKSSNKEQLNNLIDYTLREDEYIKSIDSESIVLKDESSDNETNYSIEDLSQSEQKELIDFILGNYLVD